ncbi:MAG: D-alanine--D-alanine ligase [Pseudomonadota bacterium]
MSADLYAVSEFGRVAVVMGGLSAEREISLLSGNAVLRGLLAAGVDAHAVDAQATVLEDLQAGAFDRAFLILHGRGGEDGCIQGALETLGMPYTGSGVLGSALAMDKMRTKQLCQFLDVPTPAWRRVHSLDECTLAAQALGLPLIVKPSHEGSSVGVSKVEATQALGPAWVEASEHGAVMAEQYVSGLEVTATILDGQALPLVNMVPKNPIYDFEAKYRNAGTVYHCPAELSAELTRHIQSLALAAFAGVGCSGWGRVDFIVDADGQPWLIEINTAPGMTETSLVPMSAKVAGLSFEDVVVRILATSLGDRT